MDALETAASGMLYFFALALVNMPLADWIEREDAKDKRFERAKAEIYGH